MYALEHLPAGQVAIHAYANPVVALILGWMFRGETLDRWQIAGSVIAIGGVVLVTLAPGPAEVAEVAATEGET
jgi:drug/metabolite transporter (DMT)-like permease